MLFLGLDDVCGFDNGGDWWCRRASVNRPPTPDGDDDRESEPTLQEIVNIKVGYFRLLQSKLCVPL